MIIFAQSPSPLTEAPGWFNLIIQGGSFAVLAVMAIYWLPRAVREIAASMAQVATTNKEALAAITATYAKTLEDRDRRCDEESQRTRADFRALMDAVVSAQERQMLLLTDAVRKDLESLTAAVNGQSVYLKANLSPEQQRRTRGKLEGGE